MDVYFVVSNGFFGGYVCSDCVIFCVVIVGIGVEMECDYDYDLCIF